MKAVLMSIHPKWCELIASGQKTVEIRKTRPKLKTPFKVYIYCTKDFRPNMKYGFKLWAGRGKVIGEFSCTKLSSYDYAEMYEPPDWEKSLGDQYYIASGELERSCLSYEEFTEYGQGEKLYGLHITDLKIYDEPKPLHCFSVIDKDAVICCPHRERVMNNPDLTNGALLPGSYVCMKGEIDWCSTCKRKPIIRPPQSWCYVEE